MTRSERPGQQAPFMQETFLCTQTKAVKSTNPVADPIPNPRRNAKHGCFKRRSEEILRGREYKKAVVIHRGWKDRRLRWWSAAYVIEGRQRGYGDSVHRRGWDRTGRVEIF